ncbi:hypothetical protein WS55_27620 [Burkholderia pseudomultivorans]|nr:hypothetical protein WS56_08635 [Burkholderia pseudomultivorans]KVC38548.1 hypothetical protein WS55_27620 [Burkholderia pseudomultivorans]
MFFTGREITELDFLFCYQILNLHFQLYLIKGKLLLAFYGQCRILPLRVKIAIHNIRESFNCLLVFPSQRIDLKQLAKESPQFATIFLVNFTTFNQIRKSCAQLSRILSNTCQNYFDRGEIECFLKSYILCRIRFY